MNTRNTTMRRLAGVVLGSMLIGMLASAGVQAADVKIGWVDLQRVINASAEGQRVQAEIQQKADEYARQAERMKVELEALAEDYKTQENMLTAAARRERQDAISGLEVKYNRFIQDSRDELGRIEQRTLQGLLQNIGALVVEFGEQQGYAVIFEAGNILYGSAGAEVTNDIIALYNERKAQ